MYVIEFIWKLVEKLVISLLGDQIKGKLNLSISLFPRKKYFKEIEAALWQMPFLYKETDEDILKGFVDISIETLDAKTLKRVGKTPGISNEKVTINKLKEENKILIVGSAGIGKTTLLRHTVLSIIRKKETEYFNVGRKKKIIPIFISLKSIRNTKKSPILSSIFENIPFFKGSKGKERFARFCENREVFLALDGYDEIGFIASESYLQKEILILLNPSALTSETAPFIDTSYSSLYNYISKCKVWLSTREEFYRLNPLLSETERKAKYINFSENSFSALKIIGLGENRVEFVKRIFDNYKKKGIIFNEYLDKNISLKILILHMITN